MPREKHSTQEEKYTTIKKFDTVFADRLSGLVMARKKEIGTEQLAKDLKVSKRVIELWAGKQSRPDIERLASIADYFGVTVDYLVGRSEHDTPTLEMAAVCEKYGLSKQALQFLERLNAPPDIGKEEKDRIIAKQITLDDAPNPLSVPTLTKEERQTLIAIEQDETYSQVLSMLNEILTTPTGREWETYGMLILYTIYNYCHREYSAIEQKHNSITGKYSILIKPERQRKLDLDELRDLVVEFCEKLKKGGRT